MRRQKRLAGDKSSEWQAVPRELLVPQQELRLGHWHMHGQIHKSDLLRSQRMQCRPILQLKQHHENI